MEDSLPSQDPPNQPGPRILIVDDDDAIRALSRRVLEREGFTVGVASNGSDALATLHEGTESYDLVILDLVLPWVNGLQVLSAIRHHPRTRRIPVLIVTGTAMTRLEFADARPVDVLRKPFPPERLVSSVNLLLRGGGNE